MCLIYVLLAIPYLFFLEVAVPIAAGLAYLAFVIAIPGCYLVGLIQVLARRPDTLPPPRWFPRRPENGEPAELSYFYGPAFAEVEHVATVGYGLARQLVDRGLGLVKLSFEGGIRAPGWRRAVTVPLGIGAAVGLAVGTAFGAVIFAAIAAIHAVVAALVFGVIRVAGLVLRFVDSGLLRLKNIRMTCPHCYERVPYPAYMCATDGCGRLHRDIRPGMYGIIRRRCLCEARLPTLLLLGSAGLDARCPYPSCGLPMKHRPGEAREIVLPFFGAAGAGKTRLMYGIVALLQSTAGLEAEFADAATGLELAEVRPMLAPGRAPSKTVRALPHGQTLRLRSGGRTRLLQLFDSAGELFYNSQTTQELGFLNKARTFVLVIDPLSVSYLWDGLSPQRQAELAPIRSQAPADLAYQNTSQQLEAMGGRLKKARLAVVFSRSDLLEQPSRQSVDTWASEALGLGSLVRSARMEFGETGFFRTASVLGIGGDLHPSLTELASWLLNDDGFALPPQLATSGSGSANGNGRAS
jgi:hypothetical protein